MNYSIENGIFLKYIPISGETDFTVPDGVVSIACEAFANCKNLQRIILPEGLNEIMLAAFHDCSIEEISLPSSLESIGFAAFRDCHNLSFIQIPPKIQELEDQVFEGCASLKEVVIEGNLTTIGRCAFRYCSNLKTIRIPETVKTIGSSAFYNCQKLEEFIFPSSIKFIGRKAFSGCSSLRSVILPTTLSYISEQCFSYCYALQNVTILNGPRYIGKKAFAQDESLQHLKIPKSVLIIGKNAFPENRTKIRWILMLYYCRRYGFYQTFKIYMESRDSFYSLNPMHLRIAAKLNLTENALLSQYKERTSDYLRENHLIPIAVNEATLDDFSVSIKNKEIILSIQQDIISNAIEGCITIPTGLYLP